MNPPRLRNAPVLLAGLASLLTVVMLALVAHETSARINVSVTGGHRLSPRTVSTLDTLTGRYEIVAAYDRAALPRAVVDRVEDTLGELDRRTDRLLYTPIDTSSPEGSSRLRSLVDRLLERDRDRINETTTEVRDALDRLDALRPRLRAISGGLLALRDAVPEDSINAATNRAYFEQRAASVRFAASEIERLRPELDSALVTGEAGVGGVADPARAARGVGQIASQLEALLASASDETGRFSDADAMPEVARTRAREIVAPMRRVRDEMAVLADSMSRVRAPDAVRIANALSRSEAVLVIGPPGVGIVAIDLEELLPSTTDPIERAGVSSAAVISQNAERLAVQALQSLDDPSPPIVVFTHGEPGPGLLRSRALSPVVERLERSGMACVEWPAAVEPDPPSLFTLDPDRGRPVVYLVINANSALASRDGGGEDSGAQRTTALGDAVERLVGRGESVLLGLNPSVFPTFGDSDPTATTLERFGIRARSGRALLRRVIGEGGAVVETELGGAVVLGSDHPIAVAGRGARVRAPWCVPLEIVDATVASAILEADGSGVWDERQWLGYWRTPAPQRGSVVDPPSFDERSEERRETWTIAAAGTRAHPASGRTQRLVVFGSNGWLLHPIATTPVTVDGRVLRPGNFRVLEASIGWLTERDRLLWADQEASSTPVIVATRGALRWVSWLLIAGLPIGALGAGVVWRVLRG